MKVLPKLKFLTMLPRYEQNNDRPAFRRPDQSEPVAAAASGDKAQLAAEFKAVGQECSSCHDNVRQKKK